jgi:hypothetical protein
MARHNDNDSAPKTGDLERARSTPLRPVVWMTSVLAWATVVAVVGRVPTWASVFLCSVTGISFLVFLVSYIYLFMSDRDALRAERWRRGASGASLRGRLDQQQALDENHRTYVGPERAEFSVSRADERELRVRVGEAGQREVE